MLPAYLLINKSHIKTIDTVRDNTIRPGHRFWCAEKCVYQIPGSNYSGSITGRYALRDAINAMLKNNGGGSGNGTKQDIQIELLSGILSALTEIKTASIT